MRSLRLLERIHGWLPVSVGAIVALHVACSWEHTAAPAVAGESFVDRAVRDFDEHSYALIASYLYADEPRPAQDDPTLLLPTGEEYCCGVNPECNARFAAASFSGLVTAMAAAVPSGRRAPWVDADQSASAPT